MNIFVIGKSAGAQAFIELLNNSRSVNKIFCAPGNPAIALLAECVNISPNDITAFCEFAKENNIDITVPFDEYVIQNGITNIFMQENLKIFAPTVEAAQIATSRAFAKKFIYKQKIPTPKYGIFDREASAIDYLKKADFPVVIKYDHIANRDTFICPTFVKAKDVLEKVFFDVGKKVVAEELLEGEIFRLTVLTDGYTVIPCPYVKEYTMDTCFNEITKDIGAYAPFFKISSRQENIIAQKILFPVLDALQNTGTPYVGFLSLKFLLTPKGEIMLLDCSVLPSISEAVCIFQMIEEDIAMIINRAVDTTLEDMNSVINVTDDMLLSAALINEGYPADCAEKLSVQGIEDVDEDNIGVYYNDVGMNSVYEISTMGGRPFFLTARAGTLKKAVDDLYNNMDKIKFFGVQYRKDIGKIDENINLHF